MLAIGARRPAAQRTSINNALAPGLFPHPAGDAVGLAPGGPVQSGMMLTLTWGTGMGFAPWMRSDVQ